MQLLSGWFLRPPHVRKKLIFYQGRMMSVCGKPKALVTRRLAGAFDPFLKTKALNEVIMQRLKEAVECLKRALLGADPREITIHSKLAKLHEELDEPTEAAAYHRRVVEICRIEGPYLSPNYFFPPRSSQSCRASCPRLRQVKYIRRSPPHDGSRW